MRHWYIPITTEVFLGLPPREVRKAEETFENPENSGNLYLREHWEFLRLLKISSFTCDVALFFQGFKTWKKHERIQEWHFRITNNS